MDDKRPLDLAPIRVGPPRLNPYHRLLARFYEPLFLLKALGETRGGHSNELPSRDADQERKRTFLKNLAYVCDFEKGGETTTAIALEELPDCYRFWVASNKGAEELVDFLNKVLNTLRRAGSSASLDPQAIERNLVQDCVDFASRRIAKERKFLQREAEKCIASLIKPRSEAAEELCRWLEHARSSSTNILLCYFAYEHRHLPIIQELGMQSSYERERRGYSEQPTSFDLVRHYIGRLARHIRAPTQLFEASAHLGHLIQTCTIHGIDPVTAVPAPVRDSHTTLPGILNRMFKHDDPEKGVIEDGIFYINKTCAVLDDFISEYNDRPRRVHAEVQVLEHFYKLGLAFADNDRYIACSKPACLCCELYFKYHPARMVVPSSHRKLWSTWSPPLLTAFRKEDTETQLQKRLLSSMCQDLRAQIILQVLQRGRSSHWHPDSRTSITGMPPELSFEVPNELDNYTTTMSVSAAEIDQEQDSAIDSDDGGVPISNLAY
ncbi:nucleic acid/nucleotide deaminase domain-containing protein [Aspergillus lucknowensis]|uniref:Uncharacterized protein n=1 Tax=Aspergillus lucknowensis TaxID=176173 RepID=A0ABR4M4B2_9EURO